MSRRDDEKPLPSAEEINAYLELSAARTKKRLTLAFGNAAAPKPPVRERKLRVAGAKLAAAAPAVFEKAAPAVFEAEPASAAEPPDATAKKPGAS